MKKFITEHPFITFFLVDAVIVNVCKTIVLLARPDAFIVKTPYGSCLSFKKGENEV